MGEGLSSKDQGMAGYQSKGEEKPIEQQETDLVTMIDLGRSEPQKLQELVVFLFPIDREHDGDT